MVSLADINNAVLNLRSVVGTTGMIAVKYGCAEKIPKQLMDYDDSVKNPHCLIQYARTLLNKDDLWACLLVKEFALTKTTKTRETIKAHSDLLESLINSISVL